MLILEQKNIELFLEDLVGLRFSMKSLNVYLQEKLNLDKPLEIVDVTQNKDECDLTDYNLMFELSFGNIFCDVDIYFLKLRKPDLGENTMHITEVGYEFQ